MKHAVALLSLAAFAALAACSSNSSNNNTSGKTAYFDLDAAVAGSVGSGSDYWNFPFPSDLRLDKNGAPDVAAYPNPHGVQILTSLLSIVPEHHGFPVMSTAYFRFTAPVPARALANVVTDGSVVLLDIDPTSPEVGTKWPIVALTLDSDIYAPTNLVAVAPRPGIVLRPSTQYAYVVTTAFAPDFTAPADFAKLATGDHTATDAGTKAFANLWPALTTAGIATSDVLVATTFTTADNVARTYARSEAIRTADAVTIDPTQLVLTGSGGPGSGSASDSWDGFCELTGHVTMPQFQIGTQPFDSGGTFQLDGSDVPQVQSTMTIPLTITLPKRAMPAGGFPLYQFFHGSGGLSTDIVMLGPSPDPSDDPIPGFGPGYIVALHGLAAASTALPLNPERLPGASDYEYLNLSNLAAFPYTFQQGVFEQRLLLDALVKLKIPSSALAGCSGISTSDPDGNYFFDPTKLVAGGQSMGGMYTNMIGAVEPRFGALVPTGAGGFWNMMILETAIEPGAIDLLSAELDVLDQDLTFVHPAMNAIALSWEPAEPIVSMNRIGERPLPTFSARDVYEPVGAMDSYFPEDVYDAAALSYGHNEAGSAVWDTMQPALALEKLDGFLPYPVTANRNGHTRMVVQYMGDGIIDAHYIYRQLPAVKHQYGCFLESYLANGVATVPAPGQITDPCDGVGSGSD